MTEEIWDIVDRDGHVVGQMVRGRGIVPNGFYHITVEIIPTDGKGHLLVTQRSWEKSYGAGKWEFPAGSVISGEQPIQAAERELQEETGLTAGEIIPLQVAWLRTMIRITYATVIPDLLEREIRLQPGETIDFRFVSWDDLLDMIATTEFEYQRSRIYTNIMKEKLPKIVGKPQNREHKPKEEYPSPHGTVKRSKGIL